MDLNSARVFDHSGRCKIALLRQNKIILLQNREAIIDWTFLLAPCVFLDSDKKALFQELTIEKFLLRVKEEKKVSPLKASLS
jgi:hypothetical protein